MNVFFKIMKFALSEHRHYQANDSFSNYFDECFLQGEEHLEVHESLNKVSPLVEVNQEDHSYKPNSFKMNILVFT